MSTQKDIQCSAECRNRESRLPTSNIVEALPGGGRSHVAHLNFKTSGVCVYNCLSLIVGFTVTVAIWLREVVSCRDFIYALPLLFGPCRLSEFTLAGPDCTGGVAQEGLLN